MTQEVLRGLFKGNFRHWRAPHFRSYHRLLGRVGKVGIELEILYSSDEQIAPALSQGWKEARIEGRSSREITYLFDVTDPIMFVKDLQKQVLMLHRNKIPTTGGLHLNFQREVNLIFLLEPYREDKYNLYGLNWCSDDVVGEPKNPRNLLIRGEYKNGTGFIIWQDLLAQIIIVELLSRNKQGKYWDATVKGMEDLLREIYFSIPKDSRVLLSEKRWMNL